MLFPKLPAVGGSSEKAAAGPATWTTMLLSFAGLGYVGYRKARQAALAGG
jgi:hypothetical protein